MKFYKFPIGKERKNLRAASEIYIQHYFPDIWDDVLKYAEDSKVNVGDIAILTVTEVIQPELLKGIKRCSAKERECRDAE